MATGMILRSVRIGKPGDMLAWRDELDRTPTARLGQGRRRQRRRQECDSPPPPAIEDWLSEPATTAERNRVISLGVRLDQMNREVDPLPFGRSPVYLVVGDRIGWSGSERVIRLLRRRTQQTPAVEDDPDAVLVARAQLDRQAFAELYHRYFEPIYRYCYVRLGDAERAEDAAHQVFVSALEAFGRYEETGRFRSWLYTIAHNVVVRELTARRPAALELAGEVVDPTESPETVALAAADRQALRDALANLPADQRRAIKLRIAGLTGREIATEMGRSHEAIKMLQQRALVRLRADLGVDRMGGRDGA
jgi:RNA polymerase sigma-70 factor (ECF subfamily)